MMRWGTGFAFLLLGLSSVADAEVEPAQIAGAWACDPASKEYVPGVGMQFQHNPVFGADGIYTDDVIGLAIGDIPGVGPRAMKAHMSLKGTWELVPLLENRSLVLFDFTEAKLLDLVVNDQKVDPEPFQQSFIDTAKQWTGARVSLVDGLLNLEFAQPVVCHRRIAAGGI